MTRRCCVGPKIILWIKQSTNHRDMHISDYLAVFRGIFLKVGSGINKTIFRPSLQLTHLQIASLVHMSFRTTRLPKSVTGKQTYDTKQCCDPGSRLSGDTRSGYKFRTRFLMPKNLKWQLRKNISRFLSGDAPMMDSKIQKNPRPSRGNM